ncbi:hypothetical protein B9T36_00665 [Acinetobacter sp. ANC 4204]|uniref:hypothetical protein n=1 Tax=Acinetobacter sp. ANC 4204 TaxID=1977884 RepID=UPI000A3364A8|nr:hypothetical protein [Acinetobacter sp. ANC 4204]OTG60961.1 hypothetical protein B9T36_00665 [Acinetobacter sp. ANC 4204]
MNICIGGDLNGQSFDFDKGYFKAGDIEEGKTSEYYKQKYIIGDDLYFFWVSNDLDLGDATDQVELILRKPKN